MSNYRNDGELRSPEKNSPDEANLLRILAKLTKSDIEALQDIATNTTEPNTEEFRSKSMTEYFGLLDRVYSSTMFNTVGNSPQTRNQRYEIYEEMDESTAFISSALDILSDDATQPDEDGVIIHVNSESEKIVNLVREFIEEFELEDKVSKWARAIAKYGDLFIKVEGDYTEGVTYITDTIYPGVIDRRDLNGKLLAFVHNQDTSTITDECIYAPWEFVHFRHKGDIYKEESNYARSGMGRNKDTFTKNLTSAYGQSILRPAIKVYAQLRFTENMILLARLTNSVRRNIFLINVGEVSPEKAFETISMYSDVLKKDINMNIEDSVYSAAKHTINYDEDIFIPVGDPQNDVRIEQVGGDANVKEQYDLEYLLNKLFSALKIPKAYLNYEQDLNARATLVQLDIRYARSVAQLQNTVVSGLRRLINIHLAYKGLDPDTCDLDITLTPVSAIDEEAKADHQSKMIANARDIWDIATNISQSLTEDESTPKLDLQALAEDIFQNYLEIDKSVVSKMFGKEDGNPTKPNRKIYAGTDVHAAYPSDGNSKEFKRIRESLIKNSQNESNE